MAKRNIVRVNEDINSEQVRVIDIDGKQLGVMLINDALERAYERGQDLVEIAPQAAPPVCKIIDYGKFKYEQQKREKLQKKNQTVSILKEIRLHPNTDVHDFEFKVRHAINFLEEGNKVKVSVMFKGRQMAYKEQGEDLLARFVEKVEDISKIESPLKMEGRNMNLIVVPLKPKGKKKN
ncbi:MAG: translation initiation factor IF-3 [Bacteroidetes bacterium]|nr:translation initiation factor IF-3 [Bacteroidota bacterium]